MLLSSDAAEAAALRLKVSDFSDKTHQLIFGALRVVLSLGHRCDAVLIADELRRNGELDEVGGIAAVLALQESTPAVGNIGAYVDIVASAAAARELVALGDQLRQLGEDPDFQLDVSLARAEELTFELARRRHVGAVAGHATEGLLTFADRLATGEPWSVKSALETGFVVLDDFLSPVAPQSLIVVGSRPSGGKTSLMLGMACGHAVSTGEPVVHFSFESSAELVLHRLMARLSGVSLTRLRSGRLSRADWSAAEAAINAVESLPLYVASGGGSSMDEIRGVLRRLVARLGRVSVVVIDYLQLVRGMANVSRSDSIAEISQELKRMAAEFDCVIVAGSQLAHRMKDREHDRPLLSDLRESEAIEEYADVVLLVHRGNPQSGGVESTEVLVAKNRNGPTGEVWLSFDAKTTTFVDFVQGDLTI